MKKNDLLWGLVILVITAILIIPATHSVFIEATSSHPYIMGFIKFSILATMGELLSVRILEGKWKKTTGMLYKALVWGIIGILIVFMFSIFSNGVNGTVEAGLLWTGSGFLKTFLTALFISSIMNFTFGIVFMSLHRLSDTYIDCKVSGEKIAIKELIDKINWNDFIKFVVGKTIVFFWIPAHTITFMLPPEYRVIVAAYLSIALGIILSYSRRRKSS
jgi:hypothetical protein